MDGLLDSESRSAREHVVVDLQDMLLETQDVADFLDELACYASARLSPGSEEVFCGVTLLNSNGPGTVGCSGDKARMLDELQYQLDDGPCLRAIRKQRIVHVPDLTLDRCFPEYDVMAAPYGVRSVLAVPFHLPENSSRAGLNIYAQSPDAFDEVAIDRARTFVSQASKGLSLAVLLARHSRTADNLRLALTSRTVIDMAVGIIIGQNHCSQEAAFEILKAASNHRNQKLRDVAASVVEAAGGGAVSTHFT